MKYTNKNERYFSARSHFILMFSYSLNYIAWIQPKRLGFREK